MTANASRLSRRRVLAGSGAFIVSFSSVQGLVAQPQQSSADTSNDPNGPQVLPGSLEGAPYLDSWIRIDSDGKVTVFTGKAELGQGIKTALLQIAAEQLDIEFSALRLITADTSLTPNERYTSGSHSMQDSGTAILNAAAQVRQILIAEAARRAGLSADQLRTERGSVVAPGGMRFPYGELVAGQRLHVVAAPQSALKDPNQYAVMGRSIRRVDIPAKVTGGAAYVQDMRLAGMVHARIVRPPSYGAELVAVATETVEAMPGVVKVVRDGNFLAVIARKGIPGNRSDASADCCGAVARNRKFARSGKLTRFSDPIAGTRHHGAGRGKSRSSDGEDGECDLYATLPGARCHRAIVRGCAV